MIGFLLKIAAFLVVALLAYNYFFGTAAEKAQSAKVFGQLKDVAVSVGELAKSEKDKFDAGKYDAALDKLGGAYETARAGARHLDAALVGRLDELEKRKGDLQEEVKAIEREEAKGAAGGSQAEERKRRREALHREMERLLKDSNDLLQGAQGD